MARGNNKADTKKVAKPENEKHKTVYFNTKNVNDAALFKYAQSVGVRNFSGFVKSLIYQDMIKRNGQPPNPYEFAVPMASLERTQEATSNSVTVPVRRTATRTNKERPVAEQNEGIGIKIAGKDIPPIVEKKHEDIDDELLVDDIVDDSITEEDDTLEDSQVEAVEAEEEEAEEKYSSRALSAKNFVGAFRKTKDNED